MTTLDPARTHDPAPARVRASREELAERRSDKLLIVLLVAGLIFTGYAESIGDWLTSDTTINPEARMAVGAVLAVAVVTSFIYPAGLLLNHITKRP